MTSYVTTSRTVNDVLGYVKRQFGDESGVQISDADIIRWVNAGQDEILRRSEPLKATVNADLVAGQASYVLPPGAQILRIQSVLVNGIPVPQRSNQEIEEYVLDDDPTGITSGQPVAWSEWGGTITFYPKPQLGAVNGITLKYVKGASTIAAGTDLLTIPDAFFNRLVEYVLQQAYELDENFSAAEAKGTQFQQNLMEQTGKDQVTPNTYPTITILEEDLY